MNILVIGNGFDLAHGLPTRYSDFLNFILAFHRYKEGKEITSSEYYQFFFSLSHNEQSVFQEVDSLISNNIWIQHFTQIYSSKIAMGKDGWIDFETEISTIIQLFDSERIRIKNNAPAHNRSLNVNQLRNAIYALDFSPENYIKHKNSFYIDLNRLTRCLEIYLVKYVSVIECSPLKDVLDCNARCVLSFNYTDTYHKIYDIQPNSRIKYDFIHGKADISHSLDSCNLVLGIDEYLIGDARNRDNEFIQFKKFYQRIYKGTGCHYADWLNEVTDFNKRVPRSNPMSLNVYIYGHSLDVTDADILRKLILAENATTTIFHHNKKALGDQIANLVKIIGEDELIRRTDGSRRTILFKQSSPDTV